jgi:alginate O-acetyltransferase complex protein AlgI
LFAFQIYGDFSGYSDIAIGTGRLFGFKLMRNFAFPYFSQDIAEFWRRWHISLSFWFRDYLYIP